MNAQASHFQCEQRKCSQQVYAASSHDRVNVNMQWLA